MLRSRSFSDKVLDFPEQVIEAQDIGATIEIDERIEKVVVVGMGSAAVAGDLLKTVIGDNSVPIGVVSDVEVPGWVDQKTLVFVVSYSGETHETLEAAADAMRKRGTVVVITAGGKLLQMAKDRDKTYIKLPYRQVSRTAVVSMLMGMINVMAGAGLIDAVKPDRYALTTVLKHKAWQEKAQELAKKLFNKVPLVYTSQRLEGLGKRMCQMLNENAKVLAFHNTIPQLCHNEIEGFENPQARLQIVMIQDDADNHKVKKKMLATKKIIEEKGVEVMAIKLKGTSRLTKTLSAMHLVDLTSIHLAQLYDADPQHTQFIDKLKGEW